MSGQPSHSHEVARRKVSRTLTKTPSSLSLMDAIGQPSQRLSNSEHAPLLDVESGTASVYGTTASGEESE